MKCNLKPVIIILIIVVIIALSFINYEHFTSSSGSSVEVEPKTTSNQPCDVKNAVETPEHPTQAVRTAPNHLNALNYSGYKHIPIGNHHEWSTSFK